ncbi:hypothetical protein NSND_62381 [Nitrospira sp. ND1]|nr:hypothetical protein NSND_62381 [Nitrospira sp. ND1]
MGTSIQTHNGHLYESLRISNMSKWPYCQLEIPVFSVISTAGDRRLPCYLAMAPDRCA